MIKLFDDKLAEAAIISGLIIRLTKLICTAGLVMTEQFCPDKLSPLCGYARYARYAS